MNELLRNQIADVEAIVFVPNREQQQAKATFWSFFMSRDVSVSAGDPQVDKAVRYSRDKRVREWWTKPGFQEWFYNKDEFRQKTEFLKNASLMHLESILIDPKAQASAKVAAIKLILQLAGELRTENTGEKFADEKIAQMGREELEKYIRDNATKLLQDQGESPN